MRSFEIEIEASIKAENYQIGKKVSKQHKPMQQKKRRPIIHSEKKCYKIESNAERKERKKSGPQKASSIHSFSFYKPKKRKNQKEKKRNERKLCEQLSHVAAFDTLLAFMNATAGFLFRAWIEVGKLELNNKAKSEKKITYFTFIIKLSCHIINFAK